MHEPSQRVKRLIQERDEAEVALALTTKQLIEAGVTFGTVRPPEAFTCTVTFNDGTTVRLYEGGEDEHNFSVIAERGEENVKMIVWDSTFDGQNDNVNRRIMVGLDWATGKFSFHNVTAPHRFADLPDVDVRDRGIVLFRRRIVRLQASVEGGGPFNLAPVQYHYTLYGIGYKLRQAKDEVKERANEPYADAKVLLIDPLGGVDWL